MKKRMLSILLFLAIFCTACSTGGGGNKKVKREDQSVLTVYTLEENPNLWQSVLSFEKTHPNHQVKIEIGISEEDAITKADAIRSLNTELMAGEGPDIVFLDGLPIEEYMEKGVLEDIGESVDALTEKGEVLFENVVSAYKKDGKTYAVPVFFTVPIVVGDQSLASPKDVQPMLKKSREMTDSLVQALANNAESSVPLLLLTSWNQIFASEKVDEELLKVFLENAKKIMEHSEIDLSLPYYQEVPPFETMANDYPEYIGDYSDIYFGGTQVVMGTLVNTQEGAIIQSINRTKPIFYQYINEEKGKMFFPEQILGVTSSAEDKEKAKDFVEYYLSSENLKQEGYAGFFSVNRTCVEKQMPVSEEKTKFNTLYETDDQEMANGLEIYELNPKEGEALLGFLDEADTAVNVEQLILEEVLLETKKYVYEGALLDDTVHNIVEKIKIYQAE